MARPLRIEYEGAVYHITSRGNARKAIFRDDEDREMFLSTVERVNKKYLWTCHAYCLMNNHYHLVIETPRGNLSQGMRQLNGVYTQTYNKRRKRVGHIFQGRFKAIIIEKESHLLEVCRYVVLNPVRAKAVKIPEQWHWSSYLGTAGLEVPHSCLTTEWLLVQFAKTKDAARRKYSEYVYGGISEKGLWDKVKGQIALGGEGFAERIQQHIGNKEGIKEIPVQQRHLSRPGLDRLFPKEKSVARAARDGLIRQAVEEFGYSQQEVAAHLGLHYSTISRIINEGQK